MRGEKTSQISTLAAQLEAVMPPLSNRINDMLKAGLEYLKASLIQHRRNYSLGAAWLAFVLVLVFAPRLNDPRIINGIRFMTKTGVPGLTDLGLVLLVIVPLATFFAMYSLLWWLNSRQMREKEERIR